MIFATVPSRAGCGAALALTPPWLPGRLGRSPTLKPPWRSSDRPPALTPQVGERRMRVGLLLGCVQRVVFGSVNVATARVLAAEGCEVVAPRGQECCGALHLHAGRAEEGRRRAARIAEVFERRRRDRRQRRRLRLAPEGVRPAASRVVDVNELLAELEPRASDNELAMRVAYQDACHLGHAQGIRDAPRSLLALDPGPRARRAGGAGDLLRERRDLQPRPAGGRRGARRAEGGERLGDRRRRVREREPRLPRPGRRPTSGKSDARLPALHPVEILDASIRGVGAQELLSSARR